MGYFDELEKEMFEKCTNHPERFSIRVDNDSIHVDDADDEQFRFSFNSFGYCFAHALLEHLGCNVEFV